MILAFFIIPRQTGVAALLSSGLLPIVGMYAAVLFAQSTQPIAAHVRRRS